MRPLDEHVETEQRPNARRVVVGVGPMGVDAALEFAAEEAVRAGCGLHLVHAVPLMPAVTEGALVSSVDLDQWGSETLDRAVKAAEDLVAGAVPVTHELCHGTPVQALTDVGHTARMVVLEHRHLPGPARQPAPRGRSPRAEERQRPRRFLTSARPDLGSGRGRDRCGGEAEDVGRRPAQ